MDLRALTNAELAVVGECLRCVAANDLIKNDWEFQTIFGVEYEDFLKVAHDWPDVDLHDHTVQQAAYSSLLEMGSRGLEYDARWTRSMSVQIGEVRRIFEKVRGKHEA